MAMVDRHTLQQIRIELASFADLSEIETAVGLSKCELDEHIVQLLMSGELFADCEVTDDGLVIEVHGLSECGLRRMFTERRGQR